MNAKEIIVYAGNILIALGAFGLVWHHDITWPMATAFIGVMLMPSAAHVGMQRMLVKK